MSAIASSASAPVIVMSGKPRWASMFGRRKICDLSCESVSERPPLYSGKISVRHLQA